jgi:hypothetical protein
LFSGEPIGGFLELLSVGEFLSFRRVGRVKPGCGGRAKAGGRAVRVLLEDTGDPDRAPVLASRSVASLLRDVTDDVAKPSPLLVPGPVLHERKGAQVNGLFDFDGPAFAPSRAL